MTAVSSKGAMGFNELFDPDFLTALSNFSLTARRVSAGGRHGERLSKDLGSGIEFKDYRPYSPGDDLRAIDWNIYRRLGKVFLRLFEEEQDLPLYLMPDVSASMFLEEPPRVVAGLRCTLALAAIGLNHHDSTGLFPFSDRMEVVFKSKSGKASVMTVARHLAELSDPRAGARTHLVDAIKRVSSMNLRRGMLVIVSDFFDPAGLEALRTALGGLRHRVLFIQLARKSDADPTLQGDVRLIDVETDERADLTVTPKVLQRYREAYEQFNTGLADIVRQRKGLLLRVDVEEDIVEQLSTLFAGGLRA